MKAFFLFLASLSTCACVARAAEHPLTPLSASEIQAAFEAVRAHFATEEHLPEAPLRFPLVALAEPPKALVLSWQEGRSVPRRAEVHVLHHPSNRAWVAEVDLRKKQLANLTQLPLGTQPAVTAEEYQVAAELVHAHPAWQQAMRTRGLDPALVYVDVWAPGDWEPGPELSPALSHGDATRLLRALSFHRGARVEALDPRRPHNPYDRPIEGVVATIDMNARKVIELSDTLRRPVIAEDGNAPGVHALAPLSVAQPKGSSVSVNGQHVRWDRWDFRAVLHPRDGLVIYDVGFRDGEALRKIAYRLSLSEIYVPYGLGEQTWSWRSAFDVGEYNAGVFAQSLEVNRDVPENARLLSATSFSDLGPQPDNPTGSAALPRVIALYERDAGILWTRTDPTTGARQTRLARELVVHWSCVIGNYIYGFDWIFKQDGSIEVKVALTGTTLNRGALPEPEASSPKVGKDAAGVLVAAPNHQHFLSFRLDLDVDGPRNHLMEMEVAHLPNTGFLNAFDAVTEVLTKEGHRDANPLAMRHWHVESTLSRNPLGKPTGYALEPGAVAVPYSAPDFPGLARAQFAEHMLWMTRHREGELYAAGRFPSQAKRAQGLPVFVADGESVHDQDLVLWYTAGFTHLSRPEDYPVMPTETIGFRLVPRGFFARNPSLDAADQAETR